MSDSHRLRLKMWSRGSTRGRAEPEKEGDDWRRMGEMEGTLGVGNGWVVAEAEVSPESSILQESAEDSIQP